MRDIRAEAEQIAKAIGADIQGRSRKPHLVEKRQIVMWELRRRHFKTVQIGKLFGITHSTVIHAAKKINGLIGIGDQVVLNEIKKL